MIPLKFAAARAVANSLGSIVVVPFILEFLGCKIFPAHSHVTVLVLSFNILNVVAEWYAHLTVEAAFPASKPTFRDPELSKVVCTSTSYKIKYYKSI